MMQRLRKIFESEENTYPEHDQLLEWRNQLRFLLWALPSVFRPEMNKDRDASELGMSFALPS
jgi:hypothetical protein